MIVKIIRHISHQYEIQISTLGRKKIHLDYQKGVWGLPPMSCRFLIKRNEGFSFRVRFFLKKLFCGAP